MVDILEAPDTPGGINDPDPFGNPTKGGGGRPPAFYPTLPNTPVPQRPPAPACPGGEAPTWQDNPADLQQGGFWLCPEAPATPSLAGSTSVAAVPTIPRVDIPKTPNKGVYNFYAQQTPEEKQALQAITSLAQLLSGIGGQQAAIGMPAYKSAIDYWGAILGGDKAAAARAISPQVAATTEAYQGAERGLLATPALARSGVRGQQIAELYRQRAGAISGLLPAAIEAAAQASAGAGLAGLGQGAQALGAAGGLQGTVAGMEAQNRTTAAQLEQANRFGATALELQEVGQYLQASLGFRAQDIQQMLGLAGIDLGYSQLNQGASQFQQSLAFQQQQFNWQSSFQEQYYQWMQQFQQQQLKSQQSQASGQKWGGLLGTILPLVTSFIPGGNALGSLVKVSDIRTKSAVSTWTGSLAALRKVKPRRFRYNGALGTDPTIEHVGIVADELQKAIPDAVYELPVASEALRPGRGSGFDVLLGGDTKVKLWKPEVVLMTLVNAVQELDRRTAKAAVA